MDSQPSIVTADDLVTVGSDRIGVRPQKPFYENLVRQIFMIFILDLLQRLQLYARFPGNGLEADPLFRPDALQILPEGIRCLVHLFCHLLPILAR